MSSLTQDLRYAIRGLRRSPMSTLIAVVTLTLGIGASTATFTVVSGILLKDLPYEEPDRIVAVWPVANFNTTLVRRFAEEVPALERVAGISTWGAVLVGAGDPVELDVGRVSPDYLPILGIDPERGRFFSPEETIPGNDAVVVLSHGLWQSRFGGDPEILGRSIRLSLEEHQQHTVIGIMPADFVPIHDVAAWTPLSVDPGLTAAQDRSWYVNWRIARLADGATVEQASLQVRALASRLRQELPNSFDDEKVAAAGVVPLGDDLVQDTRTALWVLLGAVGLILLIACVNVANLLLVRGEARAGELSLRSALGAGRGRIVRFLLAESVLLSLLGGGLGVLVAMKLTRTILSLAPADLPRRGEIAVDGSVLLFAVAITVVATLLAGLWPAIRSSLRGSAVATSSLTGARSTSARATSTAARLLVAAEVALAVVVALGSGLMLRSLERLLSVDPGFDAEGVVVFRPNPLGSQHPLGDGELGVDGYRRFYQRILDGIRALPNVESAGTIQVLTGTYDNWSFPTYPQGVDVDPAEGAPSVNMRAIFPGYFETLRIPLLAGRTLDDRDREGSQNVMLVNQAFVDRFWPGDDPLGRSVRVFGTVSQVVGVVGDVRQHALDREPRAEIYVPHLQWPWQISAWVVARTSQPQALMAEVRSLVDTVDPEAPVTGLTTLNEVMNRSAAHMRFLAALLSAFAVLGLVLGSIGIYGVTAYTVTRRFAEFGVRMALGATRGDIVRSALRIGLVPVLAGAFAGVGFGLAGAELLRSTLFEVDPQDPQTVATVLLVLAGVSALALSVPALRAGRVDPASTLGAE